MQIVGNVFLLFTGLLLFFGSLFIIFFDGTNMIHLFIFYIVIIPSIYFSYFVIQYISRRTKDKVTQSIDTEALETKSRHLESINPTLMEVKSIFPLELFPDSLLIEAGSVTLSRKNFFSTGWTEVVTTDQIAAVEIISGPVFAALVIKRRFMDSMEIDNLWKADAMKAKMLLEEQILKKREATKPNQSDN